MGPNPKESWWMPLRTIAEDILRGGKELDAIAFLNGPNGIMVVSLLVPKPQWGPILRQMAQKSGATSAALAVSSWASTMPKDQERPDVAPSDDPNHQHVAIFIVQNKDGSSEAWAAKYDLSGEDKVINLQPWEKWPTLEIITFKIW